MRRTLKVCKTLNLAPGLGANQLEGALAKVEQGKRPSHNQQKRAAIRNQPVVAYLPPRFTGICESRTRILHKGLYQVASFRCLTFGQAAVAGHALTDLTPHRCIVAWLNLGALAIGLLGVVG